MKLKWPLNSKNRLLFCVSLFAICASSAQQNTKTSTNQFWEKVRYGGGFGLGFGGGYTDITLAPNAIYHFNEHVGLGIGIQSSFNRLKDRYASFLYGVNAIVLYNPIEELQLSVEIEQVRVNATYHTIPNPIHEQFWNTGLYLGAGYRTGNVTTGLRYNVLFDQDKSVYNDALMPFIRFSF